MRTDEAFTGGEGVTEPKVEVKQNNNSEIDLFSPLRSEEICLFLYVAVLCFLMLSLLWIVLTHPFISLALGLILYLLKHQILKRL